MMMDWSHPMTVAVISTVLTAVVTYWMSCRLHHKQKPTRRLRCDATYCIGLLDDASGASGGELEVRMDGNPVHTPVLITYRVQSVGTETIQQCAMQIRVAKPDRVLRWHFYVDQDLQCDRLSTKSECGDLLKWEWKYINPGEAITLALVVAPCSDAKCVVLEIDAEGVQVDRSQMRWDCGIVTSGCGSCGS